MTDVNQCDRRCPKKFMLGIEYRKDQDRAPSALTRLISSATSGLLGASHMGRAAMTCPSRNLAEGQWHASQQCSTEAQQMANSTQVQRSELTDAENKALANIRLKGDPPAATS